MATQKKLLLVITKSNWGGAQRYVYDLATNLNSEYDVAVAAGGGELLFDKLKEKSVKTLRIPSLGRDIRAFADFHAFIELWRLFRRERPDIVHLNSSKAGALGALAARFSGVPRIIFTVHGWPFNEPVSAFSKVFRWSASFATLLLAHRSITVSRFDGMHAPLGLATVTVHNGIAAPAFLGREEARKELRVEAKYVIGIVAELHRNKGIDILINAMTDVKSASLVVVGDGEQRKPLEAQITALDLTDRVTLAGFVQNAASLLKAFDIFALPSRTEALGYVLLEAGFAEVPVVASIVGGIPEVIDDQLSGVLVPGDDAKALADALNELITNPATRANYAERLKEKVERYFSLRGMLKKTLEVYEVR